MGEETIKVGRYHIPIWPSLQLSHRKNSQCEKRNGSVNKLENEVDTVQIDDSVL